MDHDLLYNVHSVADLDKAFRGIWADLDAAIDKKLK